MVKGDRDITLVASADGIFGTWPAIVVRQTQDNLRQAFLNTTLGADGTPHSEDMAAAFDHTVRWVAGDL